MAETFNCKQFFLSSIRDITVTGNFWKDTDDTVSNEEYCEIVQNFLNFYNGKIKKIHIASRGILETTQNKMTCQTCRFGNIFPNGEIITCPFDIALNKISTDFEYGRLCNKNGCVLQKIILERK
jgi:chloramphenicol O-acetyltransferase